MLRSRLLLRLHNAKCVARASTSASSASSSQKQRFNAETLLPPSFNTKERLAKYLAQRAILHEPEQFLVIPKPFGISCLGYKQKNGGVLGTGRFDREDEMKEFPGQVEVRPGVTIEDCLPYLQQAFNEPGLEFCSGVRRFVSGPVILPASKKDFGNIVQSLRFSVTANAPPLHRALAVCKGVPEKPIGSLKGYATFQAVQDHKEYIYVEGRAKRRQKTGLFAVEGGLDYAVLGSAFDCSLIDICFSKFNRHLPRLQLAELLCPILGDELYGRRLLEMDGRRCIVQAKEAPRHVKKIWKPAALEAHLGVREASLPLCWHVYSTHLARYGRKNVELKASMDPPDHFVALVNAMGLSTVMARHLKSFEADNAEEKNNSVKGETTF